VFIVEYKEFAEKNASTIIELYNLYTNAVLINFLLLLDK
jgi:hypothetical protein